MSAINLQPTITPGAAVEPGEPGLWRLSVPVGPSGVYRLAQLDDYTRLPRRAFPWRPPLSLRLRARASGENLPGTWGFGLWNDPFSLSLGLGGGVRKLPALPNAAWFFFASPQNYLSLRDDLPASGALAAAFQSPNLPSIALSPAALLLPLLALRPLARLFRRLGRSLVRQDAARLELDATAWHTYQIQWQPHTLRFHVDEHCVLETGCSPSAPLGLVLWIDNQYAAFTPQGRLQYGALSNEQEAWIEVKDVELG
jgi:hypothetical protein